VNDAYLPDFHHEWLWFSWNSTPNLNESDIHQQTNFAIKEKTPMSVIPIEKVLYTAKAHTTGGREGGASRTSDGRLDVKLSVPGTSGSGTNPEQLFAVGWSACFLSAIKLVAAGMKVKLLSDVAVDSEVDLGTASGGYLIQARLDVSLPGIEPAVAQSIVDGAHQQCPYSKATHGNINVVTTVNTEPVAHVA
jgi:Ohr subfamily peroxiredoxin